MLDRTYVIVGLTCAVIGAAGYAMYGDAVKDEVTLNLPAASMASTAALALITVNPLSKFALTMDPVARGLESALGVRTNDDVSDDVGGDEKNPTRALLKARVLRTGLGLGALLAGEGSLLRGGHEPDRVVLDPHRERHIPGGVPPEGFRG